MILEEMFNRRSLEVAAARTFPLLRQGLRNRPTELRLTP
jgi:hypothetical protein